MTLKKGVADDEMVRLAKLGLVAVRYGELFQRVKKGTLDPDWVAGELQRLIHGKLGDATSQLAEWVEFYRERGIQDDFSGLRIPEKKAGFDRLIVVAQGVAPQWGYNECEKLFSCWKWTEQNLDEIVISERTAKNAAYAVWFRDRAEADEELKNLSANKLKIRDILGITLEERFLYELKYLEETGQHLDIENITLCAGSRDSDGDVPSAGWDDDLLNVNRFVSRNAYDFLRSRRAVS